MGSVGWAVGGWQKEFDAQTARARANTRLWGGLPQSRHGRLGSRQSPSLHWMKGGGWDEDKGKRLRVFVWVWLADSCPRSSSHNVKNAKMGFAACSLNSN